MFVPNGTNKGYLKFTCGCALELDASAGVTEVYCPHGNFIKAVERGPVPAARSGVGFEAGPAPISDWDV